MSNPLQRIRTVLLSLAFLAGAAQVQAQEVFVGPGDNPDCYYQSVQDAIDDWVASPDIRGEPRGVCRRLRDGMRLLSCCRRGLASANHSHSIAPQMR